MLNYFCLRIVSAMTLITVLMSSLPAQSLVSPDTTYRSDSSIVYVYGKFGMTILRVPNGFDFVFTPRDVAAVTDVARSRNYRFVINASFFGGDRLHAQHAGWLRILGRSYTPIMKDRQLTHVVSFDETSRRIEFIPWQNFHAQSGNHTIEFQTGPLVIDSNRVAHALIAGSINGSGRYTRTLVAATGNSVLWFITVRKPIVLDDLAGYLLKLSIFRQGRLDVVNLDGGPSVAFYSKSFPQLNFNTDDHLPLLLGVR